MSNAPESILTAIEQLPPLRDVIRDAGLDARRNLGQNFLLDLNLTGRIARAAAPLDGVVVEIGPGPGGLTRALLMAGAEKVIAVEKDTRAIAALTPLVDASAGRLEIMECDALEINIAGLAGKGKRCQIVANLPYNIATPLLLSWLDKVSHISSMTLMFQREVGQRITAGPGSRAYGRLSVIAQWLCDTAMLFDIPPRAFVPPPKVTSSVISLTPRPKPLAEAQKDMLEDVTRALFGQRRKMLRVSAKTIGGQKLLDAAGVDGQLRPEMLPVESFCALAEALKEMQDQ
jgi:16S rRNA (adenine1518-N6/adenine1519-N6)-dimethyltransferase